MKRLVFALILAAAPLGAQSMNCTNFTEPAPDTHEACTFPDGSGVEIQTISGTYYRTEYTADGWTARYTALLKAETDGAKAQAALLARFAHDSVVHAIDNKKDCLRGGNVWKRDGWSGMCWSKEAWADLQEADAIVARAEAKHTAEVKAASGK